MIERRLTRFDFMLFSNISEDDLIINSEFRKGGILYYDVSSLNRGIRCTNCGTYHTSVKEYITKKITHFIYLSDPCVIIFHHRRFICPKCKKTHMDVNPFGEEKQKVSDKTIENIFSSNTDIWKNVGNFQFIDNIGKTYAALREFEQDWKYQMLGISEEYTRIIDHPDYYPGTTLPEKILSNSNVRNHLEAIGENREWLRYVAFAMREANRHSMDLIGISEEEVMAFTDERTHPGEASAEEAANEAFFRGDFAIPAISLDSLSTMQNEIRLLDSLRNAGK